MLNSNKFRDLARLRSYLSQHRGRIAAGFACVFLTNLFLLATPRVMGYAVDSLNQSVTREKLAYYGAVIIGFAVAYASLVLYAPAGILASIGLFLYWIYSALADAIRLDDPNYRMTASKATRLFAVQFVLGLVERVLFLNWIAFAVAVVPGHGCLRR